MSLQEFKSSFGVDATELIHLNNAGLMPITKQSRDVVHRWVERFYKEGMHCNDAYLQAVEDSRASLARLIGCQADEIAFFQSTAGAISQVAFGMKLNPGDEVLMWDQEYASNLYPWRAAAEKAGAKLVLVASGDSLETPVEKLLAAITAQTKVIAVSWVQFQTGAVTDLKGLAKIARSKNIWTVIDVIQGLGLLPFDFADVGVDAICGGSHKWLCSPVGVGYLAIRKERISELSPLMVGSGTFGTCDDPTSLVCTPKLSAQKFEAGSRQVLEIVALGASAEVILKVGVQNLQKESERLALKLRRGLQILGYKIHSPHGAQQIGAIVNFSGRQEWTESQLKKHKISYAVRGPGLRLSPHAFNRDEDIQAVLKALAH